MYVRVSTLSTEFQQMYKERIAKVLLPLAEVYVDFYEWYNNLFSQGRLKPEREIVVAEIEQQVVGVLILKDTYEEKKICTLYVVSQFRNTGIGESLLELSFSLLVTDKPVITIRKERIQQFSTLLKKYNFRQTGKKGEELIFNGNKAG